MTADPEVIGHRAKKDTRRWCKGKPGREHQLDIRRSSHGFPCGPNWSSRYWCWHERYCTVCGKIMTTLGLKPDECPDLAS